MIGIALLGAGLFAQGAHLPAIEACPLYTLKAVYSRSQKSAQTLADKAKGDVDTYFDSPEEAGKTLDDLLARPDIAAVAVCLPILTQPAVIRKCLAAGKHVLSEKPIAGDAATAAGLVAWHAGLGAGAPLWGVAENFRFVKALRVAAEKIRGVGGELVGFHLNQATLIKEDNKYWLVDWRKVPEYQGGFLLDGGIHNIAALRILLKAAGQDVKQVACVGSLLKERLLPVDTIRAVMATESGASGVLSMSYGTEFGSGMEIEITTTNGRVTWRPDAGVKVSKRSETGGQAEEHDSVEMDNGVGAEFVAFAESINSGTLDPGLSVEEGLMDLRLLEALLRSGEEGAALKLV